MKSPGSAGEAVEQAVRKRVAAASAGRGAGAQADLFARLIVATDVEPPLAIGLFGTGGSGKSSFMAEIQAAVAGRVAQARQAKAEGLPAPWCDQVCQIGFNAWHYADADLWANLAGRIFDGLAQHLYPEEQDAVRIAARRRALRQQLTSTRAARESAESARDEAEKRLAVARRDLAERMAARDRELRSLDVVRSEALWKKVAASDALKSSAKDVEDRLQAIGVPAEGIDEAVSLPQKAIAAKQRLESSAERLRVVLGFLRRLGWKRIALLAGLALLLLGLALAAERWGAPALAQVLALLGPILAMGSALVSALGRYGAAASAIGAFAGKAQDLYKEARAELLASPDPAETAARERLALAEAALAGAQARLGEAERTIAASQAELSSLEAGRLVYELIQDRATGATYRSREGVVALVRRDLEELRERLADWRNEEVAGAAEPAPRAVDRIVLYIDDLDRCAPPRVVEVLQAVHLLLAYDLFVVVVAVDPAWIERSWPAAGTVRQDAPAAALPIAAWDYLDKVFQIPYTLPPVDPREFASLIADRLPVRAASAGSPTAPVALPSAPPSAFLLEPWERAHLEGLAGFVPTPRLAMRLVNLYRLLRPSGEDEGRFASEGPGAEHRVLQVLLAVNVGFPRIAARLLPAIAASDAPDWPAFLGAVRRGLLGPLDGEEARQCDALLPLLEARVDLLAADLDAWQRWAAAVEPYAFQIAARARSSRERQRRAGQR